MPVTPGGGPPLDYTKDPAGYMDPPKGMTQAQALEEMARQALGRGAVQNGTWATPSTCAAAATAPPTNTPPPKTSLPSFSKPPHPGIPKSQRFHEPAATPQVEVITAYKRARLLFNAQGISLRGPVQWEIDYTTDGIAECRRNGASHPPGAPVPAKSCTCGFYAMYRYEDLDGTYASNCAIEVEMFGRVVKGKTGCRAQKQRIVGVILDAKTCDGWLCNGAPMGLGVPQGVDLHTEDREMNDYEALCKDHYDGYNPMRRASLAQLRNLTGLSFRWSTVRPHDDDNKENPWI